MSVVVMICFARSGGTLLNRCIGSLPNVVILDEVNPIVDDSNYYPRQKVEYQAKKWYGINLNSNIFSECILELERFCKKNNKSLVIRDWSFTNFTPLDVNNFNPPNSLLVLDELRDKCRLLTFAFVRDSIDVWISRGTPPVKLFFTEYFNYMEAIKNNDLDIFKYEDFCLDPETEMRKLCELTNLEFGSSFFNYTSFEKVTGDMQIMGGSRGERKGKIALLPRKRISREKISEVNECRQMIEVNRFLEYGTSYESVICESSWEQFRYQVGMIGSRFLSKVKIW